MLREFQEEILRLKAELQAAAAQEGASAEDAPEQIVEVRCSWQSGLHDLHHIAKGLMRCCSSTGRGPAEDAFEQVVEVNQVSTVGPSGC